MAFAMKTTQTDLPLIPKVARTTDEINELKKLSTEKLIIFKLELKELKKRSIKLTNEGSDDEDEDSDSPLYRKPTKDDPPELLMKGRWSHRIGEGPGPSENGSATFTPDDNGDEFAVRVGARKTGKNEPRKTREGLRVLMSDDRNIPEEERPVFSEFDDPVSDRPMLRKGIVWINANHPRIIERRTKSENDPVFLEMVANYVFIVVAQYQAQKQHEAELEEERSDQMLLFRQKFFKLQRELIDDKDVSYFESETPAQSAELVT
jgi:hypothetical protein